MIPEQNIPSPPILSPIKPLKGASDSAAELNDSSAEPDDLIAFAHVAPLSFSPAGSNKDEEDSDIEMIEDNIPKNLTMVPTLGIRLFDVKTEETDEMMSVGEMNSDRGVSEVTSINSLSSLSKEHDTEEAEVTKPTKAKGIEPMTIGLPKILTTYSIQPEHVCYGCNKPTELGSNRCHKCTKCQLSVADINMEAHIYRHLYQSGYLAFECPFCIWNGWCYEDAKSHLCRNKSAAGAKGIDCLIDSRGSETMVKMFKLMRSICFPEISTQLNVVEIQKIKEEVIR